MRLKPAEFQDHDDVFHLVRVTFTSNMSISAVWHLKSSWGSENTHFCCENVKKQELYLLFVFISLLDKQTKTNKQQQQTKQTSVIWNIGSISTASFKANIWRHEDESTADRTQRQRSSQTTKTAVFSLISLFFSLFCSFICSLFSITVLCWNHRWFMF